MGGEARIYRLGAVVCARLQICRCGAPTQLGVGVELHSAHPSTIPHSTRQAQRGFLVPASMISQQPALRLMISPAVERGLCVASMPLVSLPRFYHHISFMAHSKIAQWHSGRETDVQQKCYNLQRLRRTRWNIVQSNKSIRSSRLTGQVAGRAMAPFAAP